MKQEEFLQTLEEKVKGAFFISESEHPFSIESLGVIPSTAITTVIAEQATATTGQIRTLTAEAFLAKIERGVDPGDAPIVTNFQKIKPLYKFLADNLSNLQVYRVESGVQVPVFILGVLADGAIAGVKTISIES